MTRRTFTVAAGLSLAASGLMAQSTGGVQMGGGGGRSGTFEFQQQQSFGTVISNSIGPGVRTVSSNGTGPLVIANKPVSATEERKSLQKLGDGTEISSSESNLYYRDSQGRTRVEQDWQGRKVIAIMDPVARVMVTLDPEKKTAHRNTISSDANLGGISVAGGNVSWSVGTAGGGGGRSSAATFEYRVGMPSTAAAAGVSVGGNRVTGGAIAVGGRGGPPSAPTVISPATDNTKITNEELPVQSQNGVLATGTRSTMVIPQGQIGNNRDIRIVNERWYSDDLQMLVKSLNSDPRFGDNTYQLTNISRVEPDPALFQIPPDYTVTDLKGASPQMYTFTNSTGK